MRQMTTNTVPTLFGSRCRGFAQSAQAPSSLLPLLLSVPYTLLLNQCAASMLLLQCCNSKLPEELRAFHEQSRLARKLWRGEHDA